MLGDLLISHNCTHLTGSQSNAQNSPSQASTVCEPCTLDVPAGFRKGRGTKNQIANIRWIIKKASKFQENIYFCFIDYVKAFDCVDRNKLWKILKEMGIPDHLTCLLRNLYAGQKATFKNGPGTQFSSVQFLSHVWLLVTPWIAVRQASLSITNSWSRPKPHPSSQ